MQRESSTEEKEVQQSTVVVMQQAREIGPGQTDGQSDRQTDRQSAVDRVETEHQEAAKQ